MSVKTELESIMKLLASIKAELDDVKGSQAASAETIANIHHTAENLSRKFDEVVNNVGTKQPVGALKKAPAAKVKKDEDKDEDDVRADRPTAPSKPSKTKAPEPKKPHNNIMTFFRTKFVADQGYFDAVMSAQARTSLFAEHDEDLRTKVGDKKIKAQVAYLYKAISKNKEKMEQVRGMMSAENDRHVAASGTVAARDNTDDDANNSGGDSD